MASEGVGSWQLELDLRRRTWGGARDGAGRKRSRDRHAPEHQTRPALPSRHPVHVVWRCCDDVPRLRCPDGYRAIREALDAVSDNDACRIAHASIQHNHLHLIVEADSAHDLSEGMRRLGIRAARAINAAFGRKGKVFRYRYHATPLSTPRQVRNALAYVLNNWRHHDEHLRSTRARAAKLDPYASGLTFDGWAGPSFAVPPGFVPLPVVPARTWLLRSGWRRHGLIDVWERPGKAATTRARGVET